MKSNDARLSTKADWSCGYTKEQIEMVISHWPQASMPRKGSEVVFTLGDTYTYTLIRLSWTAKKSTYGERLYSIEMWK